MISWNTSVAAMNKTDKLVRSNENPHKECFYSNISMIGINLLIFMLPTIYCRIRDWSSITGRGGATKREGGGHVKFNPYKKGGGAEKV